MKTFHILRQKLKLRNCDDCAIILTREVEYQFSVETLSLRLNQDIAKCFRINELNLNRDLSDLSKLRDQSKMCHLAQPDVFFLVDMSRTVTKDEENLPLIFGFIKEFIKAGLETISGSAI